MFNSCQLIFQALEVFPDIQKPLLTLVLNLFLHVRDSSTNAEDFMLGFQIDANYSNCQKSMLHMDTDMMAMLKPNTEGFRVKEEMKGGNRMEGEKGSISHSTP